MNTLKTMTIAGVMAVLWSAVALANGQVPPPVDPAPKMAPLPAVPSAPTRTIIVEPAAPQMPGEPRGKPSANTGFGASSPFVVSTAPSVSITPTLTAPVTVSYAGSSSAFLITDSGTGKGLESVLSNSGNASSALYGRTNGPGAGVQGANSGTTGVAGFFSLTNPDTPASALLASNAGDGPAIYGKVTKANTPFAAIYGQSTGTPQQGVGVEGNGGQMGVYGISLSEAGSGVYGISVDGYGVSGFSTNKAGVFGFSEAAIGVYGGSTDGFGMFATGGLVGVAALSYSGTGLHAFSLTGTGLYANSLASGHGITAHSVGGIAVYASSDTSNAIWGQSNNAMAVIGEDSGSGVGVYGSSGTGYAGFFAGKVAATSFVTTSDKNAKINFAPIDRKDLLERVSHLLITSWDFKTDSKRRHVGPMAQDFHAAFGLDGDDDTHINLTDMAGVSLAAIQELSHQMKLKDVQIAELREQLSAQSQAVAEMKSMAAEFSARMTVLERQRSIGAQTVALRAP
jgi:hypothetical protein